MRSLPVSFQSKPLPLPSPELAVKIVFLPKQRFRKQGWTIYKALLDAHYTPSFSALHGYILQREASFSGDHFPKAAFPPNTVGLRPPPGPKAGTGPCAAGRLALPRGRLRRTPSRHLGREAGAAWRKESCGGKKGQTLKLPGCGLRLRMLSVLSTSWQQQHGPSRRLRCGKEAARAADPTSRPPAVPGRPCPLSVQLRAVQRAGAGEGSRVPRERPPAAGRPSPRGQRAAPRGAGAEERRGLRSPSSLPSR